MERPTPDDYIAGRHDYVTTIIGTSGRLKDLEKVVEKWDIEGEKMQRVCMSEFCYWIEHDPPEFDLYQKRHKQSNTQTASFRKGIGWLLTVMLQCGYSIHAEDKSGELREKRVKEPEAEFDF